MLPNKHTDGRSIAWFELWYAALIPQFKPLHSPPLMRALAINTEVSKKKMNEVESTLNRLGIQLPDAPKPMGNFLPYLLDDNYLYISGQVSIDPSGNLIKGRLGDSLTVEEGQVAAKFCSVGLLARAKAAIGDLSRIDRLIKLGAFVNSTSDFTEHPKVVNGASDLMVKVLGKDKGAHVRFAVGSPSLPSGAAVEVEAVFKVLR